jgi:hypothetical protein
VIRLLLVALFLSQTQAAFAWGNEGHTYVNRVATQKIPASMPRFLRRAAPWPRSPTDEGFGILLGYAGSEKYRCHR